MDPVSLYDAKTHLSSLVDRAAAGDEMDPGSETGGYARVLLL
jgi:hypothetical protein